MKVKNGKKLFKKAGKYFVKGSKRVAGMVGKTVGGAIEKWNKKAESDRMEQEEYDNIYKTAYKEARRETVAEEARTKAKMEHLRKLKSMNEAPKSQADSIGINTEVDMIGGMGSKSHYENMNLLGEPQKQNLMKKKKYRPGEIWGW
jgi:hypothetical protein